MKSERQIVRTPAGQPLKLQTIATRTTSSSLPGSASAVIDAPPFAAASASAFGRSFVAKSRRHPYALST
jgi:hypothetical protein